MCVIIVNGETTSQDSYLFPCVLFVMLRFLQIVVNFLTTQRRAKFIRGKNESRTGGD